MHALELSIYSTHLPPCTARSCGLGIDYITRKGCAATATAYMQSNDVRRTSRRFTAVLVRRRRRHPGMDRCGGGAMASYLVAVVLLVALFASSAKCKCTFIVSYALDRSSCIKLLVGFKKSSSCLLKQIYGCDFFYRVVCLMLSSSKMCY